MNCRSRINNNHEQRLRLGLRFRCTERMSPDTRSSLVADRPRASTVRMTGGFLLSPSILAAAAGIRCPLNAGRCCGPRTDHGLPACRHSSRWRCWRKRRGCMDGWMDGWMLPRSCVACGCGHGPVPRPVQASSGTRGGVDHAGSPSRRPNSSQSSRGHQNSEQSGRVNPSLNPKAPSLRRPPLFLSSILCWHPGSKVHQRQS